MPRKKKEDDESSIQKIEDTEEPTPILLQRAESLRVDRVEEVQAPRTTLRHDLKGMVDVSVEIAKNYQEMLEKMKGDHDQKRVVERYLNDINRNVRDIQAAIDKEQPTRETSEAVKQIKITLNNLSIIHKIMIDEGPDDTGLKILKENVEALPTQINALRSGGELRMIGSRPIPDHGWDRIEQSPRSGDRGPR